MRRRSFMAAAGAAALAGCGAADDPRLNREARAVKRRSVAIDYASFYAPFPAVKTLVQARATAVGARVTFSDDASGSAAQVANLKRWTGKDSGFAVVAVAPFDVAAVEPVAQAAIAGGVRIVSYIVALQHQSAAITVDMAAAGRELAARAPSGGWLVVGPPDPAPVPSAFGPAFGPARAAIAAAGRVVATVAGQDTADTQAAVAGALTDDVTAILCWNDNAALGAAAAAPGVWVGAVGAPSLTSAASLDALRAHTLRCLVAPRLSALAAALVDVPFAIARGGAPVSRAVPVSVLEPRSASIAAYARELSA